MLRDELADLYAAHRLSLVRLAVLLGEDVGTAESLVQAAFLRRRRRSGRRADPSEALTDLRAHVVRAVRGRRTRSSTGQPARSLVGAPGGAEPSLPSSDAVLPGLSSRQREVAVLALWGGLSGRQAARALGLRDDAVLALRAGALAGLSRPGESGVDTEERVAQTLHDAAELVSPLDLRATFADVEAEDARIRDRRRRVALGAVTVVAVLALGAAAASVASRTPVADSPVPSPSTSSATVATTPLSSPALAPGERPRTAIPWSAVGEGWVAVATAAPADAVTTTLLLVSPDGIRYAVGTSPDGMTLQDISPDGRKVLLAIGSEALEWDLQAGTSHRLGTAYGWKTMHYAGPAENGYLVLWTDGSSQLRLEHWGPEGRLRTDYPMALAPTAGSPGTPALVVAADGRDAFVASREGTVLVVDLTSDAVGAVPLPPGSSGCEPRDRVDNRSVLVVCRSGPDPVLVTSAESSSPQPVPGVPDGVVGAWQSSLGTLVQRGDSSCSTDLALVGPAGGSTRPVPTGPAAGLVPNQTVGDLLLLGGTRCAADGGRLVAYDLRSGATTELTGGDAGGRTVRQAVLVRPVR